MKKLTFALVTAALLSSSVTAKAAYIGTFTAGSSYSFEVATAGGVEWALT